MKKLLAVILSVICMVSCLAPSADAAISGILGDLSDTFFSGLFGVEMEEDTSIGYGVIYKVDSLSGVSVVYTPSPSISFENPGTYTITSDTPLSIDYEFICWEDSKGKDYYAGDKIYVDGTVTLYAVWVEKTDTNVRIARVVKTTFEAFKRLIGKFFGILDIVVEFEPSPFDPLLNDLSLNLIYYEDGNGIDEKGGNERVLLYIDSKGIYGQTDMVRIDPTGKKATVYLFTGWDIQRDIPTDRSEDFEASYSFAELKGPDNEDALIIDMGDIVADYVAEYPDFEKYYMVVTVNDSLYNSPSGEYCSPVSVGFTLKR